MNIRFESRDTFHVSGYPMETNESSHERDIALLRDKHEYKLRSLPENGSGLYFVSWLTKNNNYIYHLGDEKQNQTPIAEDATCVEVPAACFAVATVPEGMPVLTAWAEFFEIGIPDLWAIIDTDYGIYLNFL